MWLEHTNLFQWVSLLNGKHFYQVISLFSARWRRFPNSIMLPSSGSDVVEEIIWTVQVCYLVLMTELATLSPCFCYWINTIESCRGHKIRKCQNFHSLCIWSEQSSRFHGKLWWMDRDHRCYDTRPCVAVSSPFPPCSSIANIDWSNCPFAISHTTTNPSSLFAKCNYVIFPYEKQQQRLEIHLHWWEIEWFTYIFYFKNFNYFASKHLHIWLPLTKIRAYIFIKRSKAYDV